MLVFVGYRIVIARYVAKWGIAQMRLCETKHPAGVSHHLGGVFTSLKMYRAIWGIAAIVSQYANIAISRDMGPLRVRRVDMIYPDHSGMPIQEPLNAPFLNGLFSRVFSRGKTAH